MNHLTLISALQKYVSAVAFKDLLDHNITSLRLFFFFALPIISMNSGIGQTTLLSENFGTTIGNFPKGWSSSNTSNGFVASTTAPSFGYPGSSGAINARFNNSGINGSTHTLIYTGLNTKGLAYITISWAARATSAFSQPVIFQWSLDSITWHTVLYTQVLNNANWEIINESARIALPLVTEDVENLRLRWSITTNGVGNYSIDDISVIGYPQNTCSNISIISNPYNTIVFTPANASFSVSAIGTISAYQWQVNDGTGWSNIAGAPYSGENSRKLNINPSSTTLEGFSYRCIVNSTGTCLSAISEAALLTVNESCISDIQGYAGWTLTGATSSNAQACSGLGILFTAVNQTAITPKITNPLLLTFNKKRSAVPGWSLDIQIGDTPSGPWITLTTITEISDICSSNPPLDLSSYTGDKYIRFLDSRTINPGSQRGIDDIIITCGNTCIPTKYYRSKMNGSWTAKTIWEKSNTLLGPWIAACDYPLPSNSDQVIITSGTKVTLDTDIEIDQILIEYSGTLQTAPDGSAKLTIANGNLNGSDFVVNGTFIDHANASNDLSFQPGATWELGTNSTIIRTNTSSASAYNTNYHNGMKNIPATANWIIRGSNNRNVSFTSVNETYYPNLVFESSSGIWDPSATSRFTGNTGFPTIKGNIDIGGNGPGTVIMYNENIFAPNSFNPAMIPIHGNLIVRTGNMLTNKGIISGNGFDVKGNIIIDGELILTGNSSFGKLILSGSNMQTISGKGGMHLQDVEIKNSKQDPPSINITPVDYGVTLERPISINGVLTLTDGLINTSLTNLLVLTSGASSTSGSDSSFINGPMKKIGNTDFIFPLGKPIHDNNGINNGGWRPLGIQYKNGSSIQDSYTAEFFPVNAYEIGPVNSPIPAPPLVKVSPCEYWCINRDTNNSLTNFDLTLYWKAKSNCNPGAYIIKASGVTAAINETGTPLIYNRNNYWNRHNGIGTGNSTEGSVTFTDINYKWLKSSYSDGAYEAFTPVTIGSINQAEAPLSFEIKTFKVTKKERLVQVEWLINQNYNIHSFTIERSRDGLFFEEIKKVIAKKNEALAAYLEIDPAPFHNEGYYRLRITDQDGYIRYSSVQKVRLNELGHYVYISPKPAKERLWIKLIEPKNIFEIFIINSYGQILFKKNRLSTNELIDISSYRRGIYFIHFMGKNGVFTDTFIKE